MAELAGTHGPRVLVVDDVAANIEVVSATLEAEGYEVLAASDGASALRIAARGRPDLILLDLLMPGMDGLETCRRLKADEATRDLPVLFLTARGEEDAVVSAFAAGGVDYVVKPFRSGEILSRVSTHVRLHRLAHELRERNQLLESRTAELAAEVERRRKSDERLAGLSALEAARWDLGGLVGISPLMRGLMEDIRRLHPFSGTSVLIMGESGTGKELVARAIHHGSPRARAPFVPVNCVAIPSELAESMLFGHVKGSFTGATADRKGCFELADGGTLFLDEIGDMPAGLQVKLLRVLEDGCVSPVGAAAGRRVDVRIVAATNADLEARMASGAFRPDLYFRLARYTVRTPPLRERREDIGLLAGHFLRKFSTEMGVREPEVDPAALAVLESHDYPGNVRELRNVVERALIHSGGGIIEPRHFRLGPPPAQAIVPTPVPVVSATRSGKAELPPDLPWSLADAEELLIQRALQASGGNVAEAARMLGVHRTRVYRHLSRGGTTATDTSACEGAIPPA